MNTARPGALSALSEDITAVSGAAASSVVALSARGGFPTSATIWERGYVVTADHVLRHEGTIVVTFADGREEAAEVAGRDPSTDLALLAVKTGDPPPANEVGDLNPGMIALALSRNSEKTLNVSLAVVNAIGGQWRTPYGGTIDRYLRLDVAMHPGFSGGALIDASGGLIGINSSRLSRRSAVAVPVSTVRRVVAELKEHGHVRYGYLGIASFPIVLDETLRTRLGLTSPGALIIVQVEEGSGAQRAGILQGDVLIELDGEPVRDPQELQHLLGPESIGRHLKVRLARGGELIELEVPVDERPQRESHWMHGSRGERHRGSPRSER